MRRAVNRRLETNFDAFVQLVCHLDAAVFSKQKKIPFFGFSFLDFKDISRSINLGFLFSVKISKKKNQIFAKLPHP